MSHNITLYYFADFDRSARVRWLLLELGVAFEQQALNYAEKEQLSTGYLAKNPAGLIPALTLDNETFFESGAIMQVLLQRFPNETLWPAAQQVMLTSWLFYGVSTLDGMLSACWLAPDQDVFKERLARQLAMLQQRLAQQDYIVGDQFSAADIPVAGCLNIMQQKQFLNDYPALQAYVQRCSERPAAREAKLFTTPFPF